MTPDTILFDTLIKNCVAVVGVVLAFRFVFVPAVVESFRQDLFELRRELFLLVARGKIAPTDPDYVRLRTLINTTLQLAERYTLVRFLFLATAMRLSGERPTTWKAETVHHPPKVAKKIREFNQRFGVTVVCLVLFTSPIGIAFSCLTVSLLLAVYLGKRSAVLASPFVRERAKQAVAIVEAEVAADAERDSLCAA